MRECLMKFIRTNHPERFTVDEAGVESGRRAAIRDAARCFDVLENAIEGTPYFLSRGFSVLDIYLCMLTVLLGRADLFASTVRTGQACRDHVAGCRHVDQPAKKTCAVRFSDGRDEP